MIEVTQLTKTFDGFTALDHLTLHVPKGSIYGLVGPNGAGKSTLLRILSGVCRQDSGDALICGEQVWENNRIKQQIAYIPDDLYSFPQSTIADMMRFYRGVYENFDSNRYEKLGKLFDLDPKKQLRRMSKGMQKQAAFLLTLCLNPDVIILDEPVDGLDPVMRRQIWGLIADAVASREVTVMISSHNLRELEDVCDHVGILHHGHLMLERSLSDLQDNMVKAQLVLQPDTMLPEGLDILHDSAVGKVRTLILRGSQAEVSALLQTCHPVFYDLLPLSLEEIFIYELGGVDYEVKSVIL